MGDRFLLFSLPRCGSTTLMRILVSHPIDELLNEPGADRPATDTDDRSADAEPRYRRTWR